jgi:hypothetical protein
MKARKLTLHRETVHRLDAETLREARGGYTFPAAGVGTNTQPVAFRTTKDQSWCLSCEFA